MAPLVRGGALCDDDLVQAVTQQVLSLSRQRHVDGALQVGRLVLEAFFGSDYATFRRRHRRHASYKRFLKDLPEHGVSRTYLHVAMHLRPQVQALGPHRARQLSLSHHAELLSLDCEEKLHLADEIIAHGLSVKQVRARKRAMPRTNRLGRPPASPSQVLLRRIQQLPRVTDSLARSVRSSPQLVDSLDPEEHVQALHAISATLREFVALTALLGQDRALED